MARPSLEFFEMTPSGARLFVRASPGAGRDEVAGVWQGADGARRLSVKVTAPPDKGMANAAVLKLIAKRLGLPKSALSVAAGETSRLKTIAIEAETHSLAAAFTELAGET